MHGAATCLKRIALTFDDAPNSDDPYLSAEERTTGLIRSLLLADAPPALFFCVTNKLDRRGLVRLREYAAAGHLLGNHTHGHDDLRTTSASRFLDTVREADAILRTLPNFRPYFRFPFLSEGDTREKRAAVRDGLRALGYQDAYVTVPTLDWYMQELLYRWSSEGKRVDLNALREAYVELIIDGAAFFDDLALSVVDRSPCHVLLLHENDLAAMFAGDLVEGLRQRGWSLIAPDEAYLDPLASAAPRTLDAHHGRIAALARDRQFSGAIASPWEDRASIDREFARRGLV